MALADLNTTVVKFMAAVQVMDFEAIAALMVQKDDGISSALQPDEDEDGAFGEAIIKAAFSKMSYQIGTAAVSGDTATVPLKIRCVDMADVLKKWWQESLEWLARQRLKRTPWADLEKQWASRFVSMFESPEAKMTKRDAALTLQKVDDEWLVAFDEQGQAFLNAITSGLSDFFADAPSERRVI